ncbi:tetratricopeptide repeat protein [Jeotgalibacillus sp. S-D1]|uniref:tetratricopeptide repeat protein n=1 Tax=Jeotgalibacillus sp. S-D1 TaxID=2552189 RepID=UPI00105A6551|nr:tetratricopeptide repeat protein [Jeotgalibacillus sp. S-D1]TDL34389.1 tetratricopeptide repeat protein [Jeotgalibacillus sp. S-D1]
MTKRFSKNIKKSKNVILFPGLKERLLEKGLDKLQEQHHEEAIDLLTEAHVIDPEDSVVSTSLAVALYEDRQWLKAKEICERMLHEGIGEYEETLELYIMNLLQLKEHQQIVTTIQTVIDENAISPERQERFEHLLAVSKRQEQQTERENASLDSFVLHKDLEQQMIQVANLAKQNIHPIKGALIEAVQSVQTHPFIKTMVLNILREQAVQDDVQVAKWELSGVFNPAELKDPFENRTFLLVSNAIQQIAGQEDPNLTELSLDIVRRHLFLLYPFIWSEENESTIAQAYIRLARRYMGNESGWEKEEKSIASQIEMLENVPIM